MEKVIIRDVEEPEKTEIHTKIENTKEGLKKLARFFRSLFLTTIPTIYTATNTTK